MNGLLAALVAAALAAAPPGDPVAVSAAFRDGEVVVRIEIAEGYHVNAHPASFPYLIPTEVSVEAVPGLEAGPPRYPPAERLSVGGIGEPIAVWSGTVEIAVPLRGAAPGTTVRGTVRYQACDDVACYRPATRAFEARVPAAGGTTATAPRGETEAVEAEPARPLREFAGGPRPPPAPAGPFAGVSPAWRLALAALAGLALNLTPCVYPIIPVTVGYFARQAGTRGRTIALAGLFAGSMALVYAALGTAAAMTGSLFGATLQRPAVLVGLALLVAAMGVGTLGAFEFRLGRLAALAEARPGAAGAAAMGATMGLVAAPCVGPFIVALLAYVGARGDPLEGFALFLALGLGLAAPYVPLAFAASRLAAWPRAGPFLVAAKRLLGLALLALSVYFLSPLLPPGIEAYLYALVAIVGGAWTALAPVEGEAAGARLFRRAAGAALCAAGVVLGAPVADGEGVRWEAYTEARRAAAAEAGRPVVVDFTADWCLPCRELETFTFSDARVAEALRGVVALRADVTGPAIDSEVERALDEFGVAGVPTVVFLGPDGAERRDLRLEGFEGPSDFVRRLEAAEGGARGGT